MQVNDNSEGQTNIPRWTVQPKARTARTISVALTPDTALRQLRLLPLAGLP